MHHYSLDIHRDIEQGKQGARLLDNVEELVERVFASDERQEEYVYKEVEDFESE